ncbi:hypothetical protein Sjap_007292 [Stephania japonica]|uniref:Thiaminase-2/PQQC domain-containing protein n=1 Tax=Stephania japonica TaxID=461633 RepID=A0AAP0JP16_9MAGN
MERGVLERWIKENEGLYVEATRHPFILSIRDGTVDFSAYKRWLEQDYLFIRNFVPFVASVLVKASRESEDDSDMETILGGMAALHDEILWFKKEASKWNVQLSHVVPQNATEAYCRLLEILINPETDYTTAVTAFWTIEAVYQQSFSLCLKSDSKTVAELMEACRRWGNDDFGTYCESLRRIANRHLANAQESVRKKAEEAFKLILQLEVDFWNMSFG